MDTIFIGRNLVTPLALSATNGTCINVGSNNNEITIPGSTLGNTPIEWWFTSATGWSVANVAPQNGKYTSISKITAVAAATGAATTTLNANIAGCPTAVLSLTLLVKPAQPGAISGVKCLTANSTATQQYSIAPVPNATIYAWSNTAAGWAVASSSISPPSTTYTPTGNSVGTISVTASSGTGCTSAATTFATGLIPTAPNAVSIDKACIPGGVPCSVTLTASGGIGGDYVWTIPSGLGTPATGTGSSITIMTTGIPGTYGVGVVRKDLSATNCGSSASFPQPVTIKPTATLGYTHGSNFDLLSVDVSNGACAPTSICWKQNNTGSCVGSDPNLLLQKGSASSFTADLTYPCGHLLLTHSTNYSSRPAVTGLDEATVTPNPATNSFTIRLPQAYTSGNHASIYSSNGTLVYDKDFSSNSLTIDSNKWANGDYFIFLSNSNGDNTSKRVVIAK